MVEATMRIFRNLRLQHAAVTFTPIPQLPIASRQTGAKKDKRIHSRKIMARVKIQKNKVLVLIAHNQKLQKSNIKQSKGWDESQNLTSMNAAKDIKNERYKACEALQFTC